MLIAPVPGTTVRLLANYTRVGTVTGSPAQGRGNRIRVEVDFGRNTLEWHLLGALEEVQEVGGASAEDDKEDAAPAVSEQDEIAPGNQVQLRTNRTRKGVVMEMPDGQRGEALVHFSDGEEWLPISKLEKVAQKRPPQPIDLLREGKFGTARDFRWDVTHIRLSGRLANVVYSMESSDTDYKPYQFKPVMSFLDSPTDGILIADEVGLGKTIEAGLIWNELRARFAANRLLVLCPAMLLDKWQQELERRFHVPARQVRAKELLEAVKSPRAKRDGFALIASFQSLLPRDGWEEDGATTHAASQLARHLDEAASEGNSVFDLLIVDEAHYMRNPSTKTSATGTRLRESAEHAVLLSATPIHLRNQDLQTLLRVLDEDTFSNAEVFRAVLEANAPVIAARDALLDPNATREGIDSLLGDALQRPELARSKQLALVRQELKGADLGDRRLRVDMANRIERINLLARTVSRTRKRDVVEEFVQRNAVEEHFPLQDAEYAQYMKVRAVVRKFARERKLHDAFLSALPERQISSSIPAALREWRRKVVAERSRVAERWEDVEALLGEDAPEVEEEQRKLLKLLGPLTRKLGEAAPSDEGIDYLEQIDTKYTRLLERLGQYLRDHPGEKVLVFSYFKPTVDYLIRRLGVDGIPSIALKGGVPGQNKQQVIDAFRDSPTDRVLVATEVASEGVDIQFCRVLVNYDLPWNPMRVEQRIGRLDRIGQRAKIIAIWNLYASGTIDERIYSRLLVRLKVFEQALGGLETVINDQIGQLTAELLLDDLTPDQELKRIDQAALAIENTRRQNEELERDASHLLAHGRYIQEQVNASRELERWLTPEDLYIYVHAFLTRRFPGVDFVQTAPDVMQFDVRFTQEARLALSEYCMEHPTHGSTRLTGNLTRPLRVVFGKDDKSTGKQTEVIDQFHPLVRFVTFLSGTGPTGKHPVVAARVLPDEASKRSLVPGDYAFVLDRWVFEGGRVQEDLQYRAVRLDIGEVLSPEEAESLVMLAVRRGQDFQEAGHYVNLADAAAQVQWTREQLAQDFDSDLVSRQASNEDRVRIEVDALERHRDSQIAKRRERIELLMARGKDRVVRMEEGKITKLEERFELRRRRVEAEQDVVGQQHLLAMGIIRVD